MSRIEQWNGGKIVWASRWMDTDLAELVLGDLMQDGGAHYRIVDRED